MRYITAPEDVEATLVTGEPVIQPKRDDEGNIVLDDDGKPIRERLTFTFKNFLLERLADDAFGSKGMEGVEIALKLRELFKEIKPGSIIAIEDSDYKLLTQSIRNPSGSGYVRAIMHCLMPFMRAVVDASVEKSDDGAEA